MSYRPESIGFLVASEPLKYGQVIMLNKLGKWQVAKDSDEHGLMAICGNKRNVRTGKPVNAVVDGVHKVWAKGDIIGGRVVTVTQGGYIEQLSTDLNVTTGKGNVVGVATRTTYTGTIVKQNNEYYRCIIDHTSADFNTDLLSNVYWEKVSDPVDIHLMSTELDIRLWKSGEEYLAKNSDTEYYSTIYVGRANPGSNVFYPTEPEESKFRVQQFEVVSDFDALDTMELAPESGDGQYILEVGSILQVNTFTIDSFVPSATGTMVIDGVNVTLDGTEADITAVIAKMITALESDLNYSTAIDAGSSVVSATKAVPGPGTLTAFDPGTTGYTITQAIATSGVAGGAGVTYSGSEYMTLGSAATFETNHNLEILKNGQELRKGTQVIRVSSTQLHFTNPLITGDEIKIQEALVPTLGPETLYFEVTSAFAILEPILLPSVEGDGVTISGNAAGLANTYGGSNIITPLGDTEGAFNVDHDIVITLNGKELRKGTDVQWVSSNSIKFNFILNITDEIKIENFKL